VLTADGYVMTNAHVVDGADEVIVTLTDKREFKAASSAPDRRTDVAVVKIERSGCRRSRLATSTSSRCVGDCHWLFRSTSKTP